jgi:hypothetical protein
MKECTFKTNIGMKTKRIGKMALMIIVLLMTVPSCCKNNEEVGQNASVTPKIQRHIYALSSPENGGTIIGEGDYFKGDTCTLRATANEGYSFENWTNDNVVVSDETVYSFVVSESEVYYANFVFESSEKH